VDDPFIGWLEAVTERHTKNLTFQELRRAVQALSSLYVERRGRIGRGTAFDGAGKRAAFACYFAPLHFLLVREIVRAVGAETTRARTVVDLGCGTGVAGSAWALELNPHPKVMGFDQSAWALQEAKWTYKTFGLQATTRLLDAPSLQVTPDTGVIAAFVINELSESLRDRLLRDFLDGIKQGAPILVIEAIAKRSLPWWTDWKNQWEAAGGFEGEWRFHAGLPERLSLLDKAAGLNHRELTGRSLWHPGRTS
jgi:precorrin-6B methylase 2